ncbi:MAG TPA: amidohydrolase [Vicinamibacterales bacterium]|nr:amidohydrolase [Vicinamibacterales bacterium]
MRKHLLLPFCLAALFALPELLAAQRPAKPAQRRPRRPPPQKQAPAPPPADVVIVNAKIFAAQVPLPTPGAQPSAAPPQIAWADALAIRGERIAAVGSNADINKLRGPATRVIDAQGRVVVPGLNDAHTHPTAAPPGVRLAQGDEPFPDPTFKELLTLVKEAASVAEKGTWIFGTIGPTLIDDAEATRFGLDGVSREHPVLLRAWTGHGTFFNTAAMKQLGLSETEPDPPGGFFTRLRKGGNDRTLSGFAHEYAEYRIERTVHELSGDTGLVEAWKKFAAELSGWGVTSVQAFMIARDADRVAAALREVPLPIRVRLVRFPFEDPVRWQPPANTAPAPAASMLGVWGTKWIVDGTPVERLAFLRQDYADRRGWRGQPNFKPPPLTAMLGRALDSREQVMLHASGDGAIDLVFSAMQAAGSPLRWQSRRARLEHGDLLVSDLLDRAAKLGVILVQNPSHLTVTELAARFGEARKAGMQPLKSVLRAGVVLALGSDGPANPFQNIAWATTHPNNPDEALSREEAVQAYTWGSAYAQFAEQERGAIAPGMLADLAVLSQDIFTAPPAALPATTSVVTIVGGSVVHEREP